MKPTIPENENENETVIQGPWGSKSPKFCHPLPPGTNGGDSSPAEPVAFCHNLLSATPKEIKKERASSKQITNNEALLSDLEALTATDLRGKYPGEYLSWSNMKTRSKRKGVKVHAEFKAFRSFLMIMGPKPDPSYTLDRRANSDPAYSPENCRWASKAVQTANRSNTVSLTDNAGNTFTLAEWSAKTGTAQSTLHTRRVRGWSDHEVIYGKPRQPRTPTPRAPRRGSHPDWEGIVDNPEFWEEKYLQENLSVVRPTLVCMQHIIRIRNLRDEAYLHYGDHRYDNEPDPPELVARTLEAIDRFNAFRIRLIRKWGTGIMRACVSEAKRNKQDTTAPE